MTTRLFLAQFLMADSFPENIIHGYGYIGTSRRRVTVLVLRDAYNTFASQINDDARANCTLRGLIDLPPRPECAPAWHARVREHLHSVGLTLVIGQYAIAYYLDKNTDLTDTVKSWRDFWPAVISLPHPSPRNNIWLRRNPWFRDELLPMLKQRVAKVLNV